MSDGVSWKPHQFLGCALALVLCCAPSATAADKTWTGGTGQWDVSGNWTPSGQPVAGDDVYLTQADTTYLTVVCYHSATTPSSPLNSLYIDSTGTGAMLLDMQAWYGWAGELAATTAYVGFVGTGNLRIERGDFDTTTAFIGYSPGANGTAYLTWCDWHNAGSLYVGGSDSAAGGNGSLTVGGGGRNARLIVGGTLKLWSTGNLSIVDSGYVEAASIDTSCGGTITWTYGTMRITGAEGLTIGSTGPLGAGLALGPGQRMCVDKATTIAADGALNLSGGILLTDSLTNSGGAFGWTAGELHITGANGLAVGPAAPLGASLTVGPHQELYTTNTTSLALGGTLTLSGGSLETGTLTNSGGCINWTSGGLRINGPGGLTIGASGPLGASLTLDAGKSLDVEATTTLAADGVLTLSGGALATQTLANSGGTVNWIAGYLYVWGDEGLTIGASGPLGASLTLESGKRLDISATTTIDPDGTLTLDGGTLWTGSLLNLGTFNWVSGTLGFGGPDGLTIDTGGPVGASVTVDEGKKLEAGLCVGESGTGALTIQSGGQVIGLFDDRLGLASTARGTVIVDGTGSTWDTGGETLHVGYCGTGIVIIRNGGYVNSGYVRVGNKEGSSGTVTVEGVGSMWRTVFDLYVGNSGTGTLNIQNGGQVSSSLGLTYLGYNSGSNGTVTVDGLGSNLTNSGCLEVGFLGNGTLNIQNGGQVSSDGGFLGESNGSSGTATVDGSGSKWTTNSGSLYVGESGAGTLNIQNGGQVSNANGYLGAYSGSGTATVDGNGSLWNNTGSLYVGGWEYDAGGTGSLTVQNGGQLTVDGTLKLWKADSAVTVSGGTLIAGALAGTTGTIRITDPAGGTALTVGSDASDTFSGSILDDTGPGSLTKVGSGTQTLAGANTYTGATTVSAGTLKLTTSGNNNIANSAKIIVGGGAILDVSAVTGAGGFQVVSGQTLGGTGAINGAVTINSGGTLAPGASVGTLTSNSNLTFADGGNNWVAELLGADADRVNVAGTLTLGDDTALEFVFDAADPFQAGTYTLASYGTLVGTFSSVTGLGAYATGANYGKGTNDAITVQVLVGLLPGDADLNGKVDGGDLAIWQQCYDPLGLNPNTFPMGDFNLDGKIDGGDLALWQQNYNPLGFKASGLATAAVNPEPASLCLLALGAAAILCRRRRT